MRTIEMNVNTVDWGGSEAKKWKRFSDDEGRLREFPWIVKEWKVLLILKFFTAYNKNIYTHI